MSQDKIIMYESPEAARPGKVIVDGKESPVWLSVSGVIFNNEDSARFHSHTHKLCACGKTMKKGYTKCEFCIAKKRNTDYDLMPLVEWDGSTMLYSIVTDEYYRDMDDVWEECEKREYELKPSQMMMVLCEPNYLGPIDAQMWDDVLPEDKELPDSVIEKLNEFNTFLKTVGPVSWSAGKKRVTLSDE